MVLLTDESHQIYLTSHSRLQCHLVKPKSTPVTVPKLLPRAVYMSRWESNGEESVFVCVCVCMCVMGEFLCVQRKVCLAN